jgi:hypothetical protein
MNILLTFMIAYAAFSAGVVAGIFVVAFLVASCEEMPPAELVASCEEMPPAEDLS